MMPDTEFDLLCKRCIDEWDDLHPHRQFALGSKDELSASGYHVRCSTAAESGTISWLRTRGLLAGRRVVSSVGYKTKKYRSGASFRWRPCTAYEWLEEE